MHGIGIYNGLSSISSNGIKKDYIQLVYRDNGKVYIPVEKINTLFKYSSKEKSGVKLDKLGSIEWQKKKLKVQNKINEITDQLIALYSARKQVSIEGFKSYPEEELFAREFEYDPTIDQINVTKEIFKDLESKKPMDRLLCGDVGYGKTEVAFRAMFKTILNDFQVLYLCPTTILSNQQYKSALERFKQFPVNIALLNRFTTNKEHQRILRDLENGNIDILFGTHMLLNSKIKPKKLGLLVIDEEQRFGVIHKEKIKEIKNNENEIN